MMGRKRMAAALLLLLSPGAAYAEELPELAGVVVTASRTETAREEQPAAAEAITEEDFRALGASSVAEALALAAGLDIGEAGMAGRALSLRGMGSARTLFLVDGRRMAGEDTDSTMNAYELGRLPLSSVERIEIVRGGAGALYGSDAMGGVVNIMTKRPEKAETTIGARTGTRESGTYFRYDTGRDGAFSGTLAADFTRLRKFSWFPSAPTALYGPRATVSFSGLVDLAEDRALDFTAGWMEERLRQEQTAKDQLSRYTNERADFSLGYRAKTAASDFTARLYYNRLTKDQRFLRGGSLYHFDRMRYETLALEARDTTRISKRHRLTAGAEARQLSYRGTRLGSAGSGVEIVTQGGLSKPQSETSMDFYAAYLEDEYTAGRLTLVPQVRLDGSGDYGESVTPKLGLVYRVTDRFRFKGNYGRGFRAPTLSELYLSMDGSFMSGANMWIYGNPNLRPERSVGYDLSLEAEWGRTAAKLSYFESDVDNLIGYASSVDRTQRPPRIIMRYVNIDEARLSGTEAEISHRLSPRWTVKGNWTWLDARDARTGEKLEGRGERYGTLSLRYDDGKEIGWAGTLWLAAMTDYRLSADNQTGLSGTYSWHTWNVGARRKWGERVTAYAAVETLLNDAVPEAAIAGRSWRIGAEFRI